MYGAVHRPAFSIASKRRLVEPTSSEKKPRYQASSTIKVTSLEAMDSVEVPCVFVDHEHGKTKTRMPIPLWGQYTVAWRTYDFGDTKWIVIGNQECWMKRHVEC